MSRKGRHVIFVDGVCVLCHGLVSVLFKIDRQGVLTFSTLQGETAAQLFKGSLLDEERRRLSTVIYARNYGDPDREVEFYTRSTAALMALRELGGFWWCLSWLTLVPRPVRDGVYALIAWSRYRCFGKHAEQCPLPSQDESKRFLA